MRLEDLTEASYEVNSCLRTDSSLFVSQTGRNCSRLRMEKHKQVQCAFIGETYGVKRGTEEERVKRTEKKQSCPYILEHSLKQCNRVLRQFGFPSKSVGDLLFQCNEPRPEHFFPLPLLRLLARVRVQP
jgi:hypothetical protein